MLRKRLGLNTSIIGLALVGLAILFPSHAAGQTANNDVVMILPFENSSNRPEYNWVGESFADALSDLINVPGLKVVSNQERGLAYRKLRLPLTTLPSREPRARALSQ